LLNARDKAASVDSLDVDAVDDSEARVREVRPTPDASTLLDRVEAKRLAIRIGHESGVVGDVWEVRRFDGESRVGRQDCYVVLRDPERTEIHNDDDWLRYRQAHPERLHPAPSRSRSADGAESSKG
jgi:hypothetical protein